MVHKFEEFCELHDRGKVQPDVNSRLGRKTVELLRSRRGWKIGIWQTERDLLVLCRQSADNFTIAYGDGIDFWVRDD
jgi:hypothetical protein